MKSIPIEQINSDSTEGDQNVSNLLRTIVGSKKGTVTVPTVQIPTGFVSIEQAAQILGLSVYRTRQLQWEQKIAVSSVIKRNRRVFYRQEEIERLKIEREESKSERNDLDLIRFCKRVVRSIETMKIVLNSDRTIRKDEKQKILDQFEKYLVEAMTILKESEVTN